MDGKHGHRPSQSERDKFTTPVARAMAALRKHRHSSRADTAVLYNCLSELSSLQNRYRPIPYGLARQIESMPALIVENAVRCVLSPQEGPRLAYELARDYCERYDPRYGDGLIPASAPRVKEIADFCARHSFHQPVNSLTAPKLTRKRPRARPKNSSAPSTEPTTFSEKYPAIARWVQDGWIEIGQGNLTGVFVQALDEGGQIWAGKAAYPSLDAALADLEAGIGDWLDENFPAAGGKAKPKRPQGH